MKIELTPENLIKQAYGYERGWPEYEDEFTEEALRYLAEILRGSEPVVWTTIAQLNAMKHGYHHGVSARANKFVIPGNQDVALYLHPQPDNRDARIAELEAENERLKDEVSRLNAGDEW